MKYFTIEKEISDNVDLVYNRQSKCFEDGDFHSDQNYFSTLQEALDEINKNYDFFIGSDIVSWKEDDEGVMMGEIVPEVIPNFSGDIK